MRISRGRWTAIADTMAAAAWLLLQKRRRWVRGVPLIHGHPAGAAAIRRSVIKALRWGYPVVIAAVMLMIATRWISFPHLMGSRWRRAGLPHPSIVAVLTSVLCVPGQMIFVAWRRT